MMKTGFKSLDEIINLAEPQLILLTGTNNIEELSGNIANNVCFKQGDNKEYNVLEIVRCRKEYIIQRMIINEANIDYRSWYQKGKYTDGELKRIGQAVIELVNAPKRTPKIIEQDVWLYDLKKVAQLVEDYANDYADRETVTTLVIVDVFPLSDIQKHIVHTKKRRIRKYLNYLQDRNECLKLIKDLRRISHKLRCSIMFVDNIDLITKYGKEDYTCNYLTKEHIDNIKKVNKYVDKFVILNEDITKDMNIYNVDVYNRKEKIGTCKLKYNSNCRKFEDYKKQ